jgi:hypothetical protein
MENIIENKMRIWSNIENNDVYVENITKNEIKIKMLDVLLELDNNNLILFKRGCDIYERIWKSKGEKKEIKGYYSKYVGGCWYEKYGWYLSENWVYDLNRNKDEFIKWNDFIRHTLNRYWGIIINGYELLDIYKEVVNFWVKEIFGIENYSKICKESYGEKFETEKIKNIGYELEDGDKLIDGYRWSSIEGKFIKINYLCKSRGTDVWNLFIGEYESELDINGEKIIGLSVDEFIEERRKGGNIEIEGSKLERNFKKFNNY